MAYVLFDLDGVLLDTAELHADAFCEVWNAAQPHNPITKGFHNTYLGARSTRQKLAILQKMFSISDLEVEIISEAKQKLTEEKLMLSRPYNNVIKTLHFLKARGHRLALCSNSIRKTVLTCVEKLSQGTELFDVILSGEDVHNPKPDPEIYTTALVRLGARAEEAVVFEDSTVGKAAARAADIRVVDVLDPLCITPRFVELAIADWKLTTCFNICAADDNVALFTPPEYAHITRISNIVDKESPFIEVYAGTPPAHFSPIDMLNLFRIVTHPDFDGVLMTTHADARTKGPFVSIDSEGVVISISEQRSALVFGGIVGWKNGVTRVDCLANAIKLGYVFRTLSPQQI